MADIDPQLELKKRARRRLVGAAALALLAAIVLPMVMDGEPRESGPEIQIRIPSQEGANFTARTIQVPPAVEQKDASKTAAPSPEDVPDSPGAVPQPAPVAAQSTSAVSEVRKPEKLDSKPSQDVAETKPAAKPEKPKDETPAARSEDGHRAAALLGGDEQPAASKGFLIQLGVFKDAANAQSIVHEAKAAGVGARTETVGALTRVRAGPFPTRDAADAAVAKLRKAGLSAVVQPVS
ncbi:SPOR domain-containing protein [Niveibacterium sp. SC-1]|uniref:SPOR domain-containing protein n=1 Tax=Niveibacterium sp. SC-1 TaxID=3135646 RepID=UPI00311DA9C8